MHRLRQVAPSHTCERPRDAPAARSAASLSLSFVPRSANSYFELEWRDGRVCVRAANGKYVAAKKNGQLAATVDAAGQSVTASRCLPLDQLGAFGRARVCQ